MKPLGTALYTDMNALAGMKAPSAGASESERLREVAQQFEALFTHMLMKNMREASLADGIFDSEQSRFYRDMFDQQMSTELSRTGGLGIADLLVRQLGNPGQPREAPLPIASTGRVRAFPIRASGLVEAETLGASPDEFVSAVMPHAQRVGEQLGVSPRLILAQAALETGCGQRPITNADGSSANNLFGIKATGAWPGGRTTVSTLEFESGVARRVSEPFRSYPSLADGFSDYGSLIGGSARYRDALNTGDDAGAFATALQRGGYATDPDYAGKLTAVAEGPTLNSAISALKKAP